MPWGMVIENGPFLENPPSHNPLLLTEMVSTILWTITLFLTDINKTLLSHTILFEQMTWTTFWTKRRTLSKRSSYEKRCFKLEDHPRQTTLPKVDHSKGEKKWMNKRTKRKIDCHVMHLKNSTESKQKSRKPNSKKKMCWKSCINTNHWFPVKNCFSV